MYRQLPLFRQFCHKKGRKKIVEFKDCFSQTFSMSWEGSKYDVEKYTFTDADAGDLPVNERSDDYEEEEINCAPTTNFSVWYRKSLTVGVKEKETFHFVMWHMSWQAGHMVRRSGGWWLWRISRDSVGRRPFVVGLARGRHASQFLNPVSINLKKLPQMPASGFLNHSGRNWPNPDCSFYLPVSMCRNSTVKVDMPLWHMSSLPEMTSKANPWPDYDPV